VGDTLCLLRYSPFSIRNGSLRLNLTQHGETYQVRKSGPGIAVFLLLVHCMCATPSKCREPLFASLLTPRRLGTTDLSLDTVQKVIEQPASKLLISIDFWSAVHRIDVGGPPV
jgi:hypothetical protein